MAEWKKKDPIIRLGKYLVENKHLTEEECEEWDKRTTDEIEAAVDFAKESPYPSLDTIQEDVYA